MFTSELLEARQTEVPIRDIDEHAVDLLVNFCYTSEITIEESNVQTLLPAGKIEVNLILRLLTNVIDMNIITVLSNLHNVNIIGLSL